MKNNKLCYIACLLAVGFITAISSYSFARASIVKSVGGVSFVIRQPEQRTITLYKNYNGTSWNSYDTLDVFDGNTIDGAVDPSVSGYDFLGWRASEPSSSEGGRSVTYSTSQLNDVVVNGSDLSFYPVFKSSSKKAYADSTYYEINADIVINSNIIGSTSIGFRYLGVSGIYDVTSTWNDSRSLYSASGIYKFSESGNGAANLHRKIGFKANSTWKADCDGGVPCFGIYSWDGNSNDTSVHMGVGSETLYAYIPADWINFKFSRYSHNASSFTWGNESANLSFDNSWWWNGSSTNKYTKDSVVLSMNDDANNGWGSNNSTWVAS